MALRVDVTGQDNVLFACVLCIFQPGNFTAKGLTKGDANTLMVKRHHMNTTEKT